MKRKLLYIGMFLLLSTATSFAQIEKEIDQSKVQQIRNGREYLLEKFLERDYDKVKEIKDYLLGLETEDYIALYPWELRYILFWTQEFDALSSSFRQENEAFNAELNEKIGPNSYQLSRKLYLRCVEDEHLLRVYLQEATMPSEDKDFLTLFLDWDLKPSDAENMNTCNKLADQFLANYPNSDYEWFVRHKIRNVYVENWGWGMGASFCAGLTTGRFARSISGMGMNIDLIYRKLGLTLGYETVDGKTAVEVPYSISSVPYVYPKGSRGYLFVSHADVKYFVIEKEQLRLAPFVGFGGVLQSYPNDQIEGSDLKDQKSFNWAGNAGLCFDIKCYSVGFFKGYIRLKYQFDVAFPNGSPSTIHMLSLGLTYIVREKQRDL